MTPCEADRLRPGERPLVPVEKLGDFVSHRVENLAGRPYAGLPNRLNWAFLAHDDIWLILASRLPENGVLRVNRSGNIGARIPSSRQSSRVHMNTWAGEDT